MTPAEITPDRCGLRSDGALIIYDRPALQPGAKRLRIIPPDVVRQHLASATRAALERAGLIVPDRCRHLMRDRVADRPGARRDRRTPPPPR